MKRTIAIRLLPTRVQADALGALQLAFSAACNTVAGIAFDRRCTNRVRLHHLAYYAVRQAYPRIGSQLACNAIAAVSRSLRTHRANRRPWMQIAFRANASVHVDARTYRVEAEHVSVFTMGGRERIAMRVGAFQRRYLDVGAIREAEVCHRRGRWYLHVVLDVPQPTVACNAARVLGVDLGENVAAAISTGTLYGGGRERIAMGKRMRTRLHRWAWRQLQTFIAYKAQGAGIEVLYVNPAYTSQTCSACGTIGGRSKHRFSCKKCGIFAHSDRNAARNLAKIGASALAPTGEVMRPHVAA